MFELVDSETVSRCIARAPGQTEVYARIMADLALTIHAIDVNGEDAFPAASERIKGYLNGGLAYENQVLAKKCLELIDALPASDHLIHGDFHTGNVFLQNGEPLLIDMDRISRGHPIIELSDLYYFYVILGEDDPSAVEDFMGFPYQTAVQFFDMFLKNYLRTDDETRLSEVKEKASLIGYARLIRKLRRKGTLSETDRKIIDRCIAKLERLSGRLDTLTF